MGPDLKDELARVRTREKRFKDSAEAQISSLQEQLEAMTVAKNCAEAAAKYELEKLCLEKDKKDTENSTLHKRVESLQSQLDAALNEIERQRHQFKIRCMELEEENTQLQKELSACTAQLEDIAGKYTRLQENCETLKKNLVLVNVLCEKIPQLKTVLSGLATQIGVDLVPPLLRNEDNQ